MNLFARKQVDYLIKNPGPVNACWRNKFEKYLNNLKAINALLTHNFRQLNCCCGKKLFIVIERTFVGLFCRNFKELWSVKPMEKFGLKCFQIPTLLDRQITFSWKFNLLTIKTTYQISLNFTSLLDLFKIFEQLN